MTETTITTTATADPTTMTSYIPSFNPAVVVIIIVILIGYFVFFYYLGDNTSSEGMMSSTSSSESGSGSGQTVVGVIVIAVLLVLIVVNALQYFFNISVTAYVQNLFTNKPTIDIVVDQSNYQPAPVPEIKFKKQVFNIPGNYYNYENAKALCTSYGSALATYKQIEDAYGKGAEWGNYGWSDGQNAFFPTQQKTFDNLQGIPGHEHDLGRPGVNGGYIANPEVRFGANCYGHKPKMTPEEQELMKTASPYPQTIEDQVFQKRVDFWKTKVDQILVSPFNYSTWS
jgi:hypothetical protein